MLHFLIGFWDYVVVFLVILTIVVFVHEMGHFLVARLCGVRVEVFSIGFGPELFGRTARSGTRWKVSLLPLGGYVKMFGDADAASTPNHEAAATFSDEERKVAFQFKTVYQRAAIVAAGPVANFVFGILALAAVFLVKGEEVVAPVIGVVMPDSAAAEAGLKPGDRVVEANGRAIERFRDLQRVVGLNVGEPVTIVVRRDDQVISLLTHPRVTESIDVFGNAVKRPLLGVQPKMDSLSVINHGPISALGSALRGVGEAVSDSLTGVGQMLVGKRDTDQLRGPIGIAKTVGDAAQFGISGAISMMIFLSINLGLINLFPIPLLDGGHLLFYGVEALCGRPLGPRAQEYGFRVGLFLVLALMLVATRNDLVHWKVWDLIKGIVS